MCHCLLDCRYWIHQVLPPFIERSLIMYEQFEYMQKLNQVLETIYTRDKDVIARAAELFAENIRTDHVIHTFGTGHSHMVGIELFARAGGLGNIDAMLDPDTITSNGAQRSCALEKLTGLADIIYDQNNIVPGDLMIITSNSGRNAVPVELALRCKKEGIYTIAITNVEQSSHTTSRQASGKRLFECVDMVIDNCCPKGDALMTIGNLKTGAATSIASMFIVDTIVTEAIKLLTAEGFKVPVFQSQNIDGFDNDDIYAKYAGRIKQY